VIPPLTLQSTLEENTEKMQANLKEFATPLENCPLLDGNYLEEVALAGGVSTRIVHGLGRQIRGWILCDLIGNAAIVRRISWDSTYLTLHSNLAVTVNLWVF
jgi:hypothetical protein